MFSNSLTVYVVSFNFLLCALLFYVVFIYVCVVLFLIWMDFFKIYFVILLNISMLALSLSAF